MAEHTISVTGVVLVGSEAVIVPMLAIIGAVTVMGLAGYGTLVAGSKVIKTTKERMRFKRRLRNL